MRPSIFLTTLLSALASAAPVTLLHTIRDLSGVQYEDHRAAATILFDIDGNEARASFKVPVPGKNTANVQLLALSVQAISGLGPGQDARGVICQAYGEDGLALGRPFDLLTRSLLSGDEKKPVQVVVGVIECAWK